MYRWDIRCKIWLWSKYQYSSANVSMGYMVQNMALEQISVHSTNVSTGYIVQNMTLEQISIHQY
jgi:hypothetical protein